MGHYKANLRDVEFNLFEVFDRESILGRGPFAEIDAETVRAVLDEVRNLAEGPLAESFTDADRHPPVYDPQAKTVTLPAGVNLVALSPPRITVDVGTAPSPSPSPSGP